MKKTFLTLLLGFSLLPAGAKSVVFTLKDGTLVYYLLGGEVAPVMRFGDEGTLTINADSYEVSGIKNFYISQTDDPSAVATPQTARPTLAGGLFSVHAAAGTAVAVFNLVGTRQDIPVTQQGNTVTLDLHALPRGIYIIKVGKESFKINKK